MSEQLDARRRRVAVAITAAAVGTALLGLGGAAYAAPGAHRAAAPQCTVDFSASDEHPAVGQNIMLRWSSAGADQLVASWTTAAVPSAGTQVTTEQMPGPVSYQVTGLKSGQYCGGAVVNVVYAAVVASTPTPAPTTSSPPSTVPTTAASSPSSSPSSTSSPAPTSAAPSPSQVTYPAQSPTGGSSTPWYAQPVTLLVLGLLSLSGSIALFNRERVHAVLVRRH